MNRFLKYLFLVFTCGFIHQVQAQVLIKALPDKFYVRLI